MLSEEQTSNPIASALIEWYANHRRDLPWRETSDPYKIWISEVILQQTRVAQGIDYYFRFIDRFPDIRTLAEASEDEVLRHWQGLGYYSRARNVHAAAGEVMSRFGGRFPEDYAAVRSLRGIGDYTAAAIVSFAFGLPYAVVDGNVYRLLARLFDVDLPIDSAAGKRYFAGLAQELLPEKQAAAFNQAMMEFGALQCVPKSPDCPACPLSGRCLALAHGRVASLPVKKGVTEVKPRWFNYLVVRCGDNVLLDQRTGKDIWQNLYEYPLIETDRAVDFAELQQTASFAELFEGVGEFTLSRTTAMPGHVLSHRVIHAVFHELSLSHFSAHQQQKYLVVPEQELDRYAVSRLITRFREKGV
jgi:A/G-specific adenine glycosylase